MAEIKISFAQNFAVNQGVNFQTGFSSLPLPQSIFFPQLILTAHSDTLFEITDINGNQTNIHRRADSTDLFNSNLVFKSGGNLSQVVGDSYYPRIKIRTAPDNLASRRLYGDFLALTRCESATDHGSISIQGTSAILNTAPNAYSFSSLITGYAVNSTQDASGTNTSSYPPVVPNNSTFKLTCTCSIPGLKPGNAYNDHRCIVGAFRDHRGGVQAAYHPTGFSDNVKMDYDSAVIFHPFYTAVGFEWYCLIIGANNVVLFSQATGHNAHQTKNLKIDFSSTVVIFYVNDVVISVTTAHASNSAFTSGTPTFLGARIREVRSTGATLPNSINWAPSAGSLKIDKLVVTPAFNAALNENTISVLDTTEIGIHETGTIILKKLK